MKDDEAVKGLATAVNQLTSTLAPKIKLLSTWNRIDEMSKEELDALAWELHISWYDYNANLSVKRQIIKDSDLVHSKLGTNWAVERVIETYFGSGRVVEWFDYDGEPFHFKIQTTNQRIKDTKAEEFLKILDAVKRKSAHLDAIEVIADGQLNMSIFLGYHETEWTITKVV